MRWKDLVRAARGLERRDRVALVSSLETAKLHNAVLFKVFLDRLSGQPIAVWSRGLQALNDLTIQSPRDEALDALARDATLLEALQGAVAARPDSLHFATLKVLCIDGSPTSVDALLPVVHHALQTGGPTLDRLLQAERTVRAKGRVLPASIETVFATLHARQQARQVRSGVAALFERLDLETKHCAFRLTLQSADFKLEFFADGNKAHDGFALYCSRLSSPNAPPVYAAHQVALQRDEHGLGVCTVETFPEWLARAATGLPTQWLPATIGVEARKAQVRERVATWALSGLQPGPKR